MIGPDVRHAEPVPVKVTRWLCPFCRRGRSARKATAEHLGRCWLNPANQTCKTCANFEEGYDACGCEPGCNWGGPPGGISSACSAGVDISGEFPKTGCPLWALRKDCA